MTDSAGYRNKLDAAGSPEAVRSDNDEIHYGFALGITADRDRGVSYNAELGKIKGATQDLPSRNGILVISKSALKMAYMELPKITPEGADKLYYAACMSAK